MHFGTGLFGGMPFGADPPTFGAEYQRVAPPAAVYFDPKSRDFLLASDGRYIDMGTVEQQVALSFSIPRESLAHAPEIGHDFLTLPRLGKAALDAEIDRRAKLASPFDRLLRDGVVEFVGAIEKQHPKDTETRLAIAWRLTGVPVVRTTVVGPR